MVQCAPGGSGAVLNPIEPTPIPMKSEAPTHPAANICFHGLPVSEKWRLMVRSFLMSLAGEVKVDRAEVKLRHHNEGAPAFEAEMKLEVPGPDLQAKCRGATLMEAWKKSCERVAVEMDRRKKKRLMRFKQKSVRPSHA